MSAAGWGSLNLTDELPPKGRKPKCRTDNDESSLNQKRARKMPPPSQSSTPTEGLRKKQTTKTQTRVTRFSSERAKRLTRSGQLFCHSIDPRNSHSATFSNLSMRVVPIDGKPVVFMALKDLPEGTEVDYDYGEKCSEVVGKHPWLKS